MKKGYTYVNGELEVVMLYFGSEITAAFGNVAPQQGCDAIAVDGHGRTYSAESSKYADTPEIAWGREMHKLLERMDTQRQRLDETIARIAKTALAAWHTSAPPED